MSRAGSKPPGPNMRPSWLRIFSSKAYAIERWHTCENIPAPSLSSPRCFFSGRVRHDPAPGGSFVADSPLEGTGFELPVRRLLIFGQLDKLKAVRIKGA